MLFNYSHKEVFPVNMPRPAAFAASMALMLLGSSAIATTNYSHPQFTVAEDRALNLRETGSQIVMETIEDAIRQGGLALLGEGFQIDSSLSYVTEESSDGIFRGEIDLVIPFWSKNGHVIFTQPGFVFWEGPAEEERVDGNLGIVYRTNLANTPIGIDAIGGASLFYDYDFHRVNHERLGIGVDMQSGNFHGAFNYYYPLSNEEGGREGFIEEALKGMDLRFALERETIRAGARLGLWRYDGGEDVADEWRSSVGFDAGFRILPGVFIEGEWEKHQEDLILDQRLSLGLAFRFSLPDFKGKSYADGSMSSNLYKVVEREKRVLYEERETGPRISIVRTGNETIAVDEEVTVAVDVRLSEALAEDVTINLVGSGSATYGADGDWVLDNGSGNCDSVEGTDCQVAITAGEISPGSDVEITINDDGRTNENVETIILSMVIASAGDTGLTISDSSLSFTIPADIPLPAVSLSADTASLREGGMATLTLTLSEELEGAATFNLVANTSGAGRATYGTSADWNLSVGGTDCSSATESSPCQVMISQGQTSAEVTLAASRDSTAESSPETATVSIAVDQASESLVILGGSSNLDFTIRDLPTVSLNYSGSATVETQSTPRMRIDLSEDLSEEITLNITHTGTGHYQAGGAMGGAWELWYQVLPAGMTPPDDFLTFGATICRDIMDCSITIPGGQTIVDIEIVVSGLSSQLTIIPTLGIDSSSMNLVELGTPSHTITIQ